MIMQLTHHVVDCPTCGRPVEIKSESLGCELGCGHCRGRFVAFRPTGSHPVAAVVREDSMLERANRLLNRSDSSSGMPRTIILVEHRDEIFARLAADVEQLGLVVIRAESTEEALQRAGRCELPLVIANRDLPDQNGWELADELRLAGPDVEAWLYMPQASTYAEILAHFTKVTEFMVYGGDLFSLSDAITDRLAERHKLSSTNKDLEELAAA